jgi:endoglucanase
VPLNEDCWLDRETAGLDKRNLGPNYQAAIREWVSQITGAGMVAIVDLHLSAPKGVRALAQQPMADADNAPDFWRSAAAAFKDNPLVVFDVFNEPYLDRDEPPPADRWGCWRDGCTVYLHEGDDQHQTTRRYEAAGMRQLVEAVRSTDAANPIMLGGLNYADDLDGLTSHLPSDPRQQLIAAWHPYAGNRCGLEQPECWNSTIASVMATMPVVAGEFGRDDCTAQGLDPFMDWMDQHGGSYLAWVWTVVSEKKCPGKYDLIVDYDPGTPTTPYGASVQAHYRKF